jgi:hypothetical protein
MRSAPVPPVLDEDGKRPARHEGPCALGEVREAGMALAPVAALLTARGRAGDGAPVRAAELVAGLSLGRTRRLPTRTSEGESRQRLGL